MEISRETYAKLNDELDAVYTEKDRIKEKNMDLMNANTTFMNWQRLNATEPEFRALISPVQWAIAASISNGDLATNFRNIWQEVVTMTSAWGIDK